MVSDHAVQDPWMTVRDRARAAIPPSAVLLMDRIEAAVGAQITFGQNSGPTPEIRDAHMAANITHNGVEVLLHDPKDIPVASFVHELLHAERGLIEGVPQLVPVSQDPLLWRAVGQLENALEHAVIVPREAHHGLARPKHWQAMSDAFWPKLSVWSPSPDNLLPALCAALDLDLFDSRPTEAAADAALDRHGLRRKARLFRQGVHQRLEDPSEVRNFAVAQLGWPVEKFLLRRIDIANRRPIDEPL
jgi:hypothetical protein